MLAVKDLVNPNITNKKTDLKINQNMNLKDIDLGISVPAFTSTQMW